ncbi:MAG TPA: hypothetical protein VHH09_00365, partial [Acidimicrobiales bacterium]|nr:hypothetical protein [Acidimicrobiales bacterium]
MNGGAGAVRQTADAPLPPAAWAAALAALPAMGPARLAAVLGRWQPAEAWLAIVEGRGAADPAVARACAPDARG